MKNAIIYYYNLKIKEVHQNKEYYWFEIDNQTYHLYKANNTNINELLEIVNYLTNNKIKCHIPILNNQNTIITTINEINYILFKLQIKSKDPIIINDILKLNKIKTIKPNKPTWYELWTNKIDYLELQISEFGIKYPKLRKSFPYFCGLAETAIQLLEIINTNEYTINHKIIKKDEKLEEFLNPLNMTIDLKTRDLAEYLKTNYNHISNIEDIKYIIKIFKLNSEEIKLLFARTLFPNYYFNIFEEIIAGEKEENSINKYIDEVEKKERLLKTFYKLIKTIVEFPIIDYLEH